MSRKEVLAAVQAALSDVPKDESPSDVPVPRDYELAGTRPFDASELVRLLTSRLLDYGAEVVLGAGEQDGDGVALAERLVRICEERDWTRVAVAAGIPFALGSERVTVVVDDPSLPIKALDEVDTALTYCALAIAETGTLILDGSPRCGRRALSLIPDAHIAIVPIATIVKTVPDAIAALDTGRNLTLVSGPSATSDIELERVEGVHGPRSLVAVLI